MMQVFFIFCLFQIGTNIMFIRSQMVLMVTAALLVACHNPSSSQSPSAASASPAAASESQSSASQTASASASPKAVNIRKDDIGGDFTLTDGSGKPFSLSSLKGKVVVLAFGFTNCPDVCPTELFSYSEALQQLGEQAKDVAVVFVSVDPDRDTPDLIGRYAKQFNPTFIGLTDTNQGKDIAVVKQQYRIVSAKTEVKSDTLYNVDHTSGAYLIDKKGETALFEPYGAESTQIAADIRSLLAE